MSVQNPSRPHPLSELTTRAHYPRSPLAVAKGPCKLALGGSSGQHYTAELLCLLRSRLRIAVSITFAATTLFLLKAILDGNRAGVPAFDLSLMGCIVALTGTCAGLLWSRVPLTPACLRSIEFTVFGVLCAFFAWIEFQTFRTGRFFQYTGAGPEDMQLRFAAGATALRSFVLVTIYGTFIPNTWRLIATIVGTALVLPLVVALVVGLLDGTLGAIAVNVLPELTLLMAIAGTITVFGSYKINALQEEAFEAKQLGQYRLKDRLGQGGMGEVYLGEHVLLRRPCAIKLIRPEQAGDPANLVRFEREVQATAALTHWNTVEIYDYGHTEDGTFYYVMEYLPGLSLQDLVEKHGPVPPERAIHFLRQACAALREAHGHNLIHRDIKPSNILACERGGVRDVVKLVDFGLVQSTGLGRDAIRLTVQGAILGSPPYMAPEQAAGKSLDVRSDIYSLGAVGYFLLTGHPPFVRETAMEMLLAHAYEPAPALRAERPEVPPELETVILRCLEKDPARRYQDVGSLDRALASCAPAGAWTEERAEGWWQEVENAPQEREAPVVVPA